MPFRDIIVSAAVFGSIPFIFRDPYWGEVVWNWLAFMNAHQYTWGFARSFRFSLVVAVTTLLSAFIHGTLSRIRWRLPVVLMTLLALWVTFTTFLSPLNPEGARVEWARFLKIVVMLLVLLGTINDRKKLDWMIWVVVISLGFFGFKGGIFTIAHGGAYPVGGPEGSYIAGNNEMAFALVICLPLIRYLHLVSRNKRVKTGLVVLMFLCCASIIGSWSRGAFLAGAAMTGLLWLRSRKKALLGVTMVLCLPLLLSFMPDQYFDRLRTIETYQQDSSAMGRINAWYFAWNLAVDHPITGGGARAFTEEAFWKYAPNPEDYHDAHSIYFEMLGEQGFVGLGLFLAIGMATLNTCSRLRRLGLSNSSMQWAQDLGSMIQVSVVGYAVGGAFLGLAYFDLPYTVMAFSVLGLDVAEKFLRDEEDACLV